jgi:hypothetical protein
MSTVLFSRSFIEKINTIIERFWWAGVQEDQRTSHIAYRSWEDICRSKQEGGLGIRDLHIVNKSLIIHSAWNVATKKYFLSVVLKSKYHPHTSFWTAPNNTTKSIYWTYVLQVRQHLTSNATFQMHAGNTSIWSEPWAPIWENINDHLLLPVINSPLPSKVADLWIQGTHTWNQDLLSTTFSPQAVQAIQSIQVVNSDHQDILRWTPSTNGLCTTKAIYNSIAAQDRHNLPTQGSRSLSRDANLILQKVWKSKVIPPLLKTFAWRLIRRALPTGERAGRFSTHINNLCSNCGQIENDVHLFFKCDLPSQVWAASSPLPTHIVSDQEDGVQTALPLRLPQIPWRIPCATLYLLYGIYGKLVMITVFRGKDGPLFRYARQHRLTCIFMHNHWRRIIRRMRHNFGSINTTLLQLNLFLQETCTIGIQGLSQPCIQALYAMLMHPPLQISIIHLQEEQVWEFSL